MTTKALLSSFGFILFASTFAWANGTAPANSELVVDEPFDSGDTLSDQWHINTGQWSVQNGVLRASEIKSEKHSAAARRKIVTENAVYELRFRFVDGGSAFHFGFDPAKGELDKKGHLFSVVVTPGSWKILKHVDKSKPKEAPNENLALQKTEFKTDQWYTLRLTTWETFVTASIEGKETLKASDPSFSVKKPTLVFRCTGDGVEVDDVLVWSQIK